MITVRPRTWSGLFGFLGIIVICFSGCQGSAKRLVSSVPGRALLLDSSFKVQARLGEMPSDLAASDELVERYGISRVGLGSEYLIVLEPSFISGDMTAPTSQTSVALESGPRYNNLIDLTLRAHRQILRSKIDEAGITISLIESKYGESFASITLRGIIAYILGRPDDAIHYFRQARAVFPEGETLEFLKENPK